MSNSRSGDNDEESRKQPDSLFGVPVAAGVRVDLNDSTTPFVAAYTSVEIAREPASPYADASHRRQKSKNFLISPPEVLHEEDEEEDKTDRMIPVPRITSKSDLKIAAGIVNVGKLNM